MPEGPEVKRVVDGLQDEAIDRYLVDIKIVSGRYSSVFPEGMESFLDKLPCHVENVSCKGKFIWWEFDNGWYMFSTLGMTGSYKRELSKHTRVAFVFEDDDPIYYTDMRNFGTLKFVNKRADLDAKLKTIGPDMLSDPCKAIEWVERCKRYPKKTLVSLLMDQKIFSGVGNIYKSESLFLARLRPDRLVSSCTDDELYTLYRAVTEVLANAYLLGGATIRNYSDLNNTEGKYMQFPSKADNMMKARLGVMVYSRPTDPFGNSVEKIILDDKRTTWWSPTIQK